MVSTAVVMVAMKKIAVSLLEVCALCSVRLPWQPNVHYQVTYKCNRQALAHVLPMG